MINPNNMDAPAKRSAHHENQLHQLDELTPSSRAAPQKGLEVALVHPGGP
jgi:hypothetical protein